MTEAQVLQLLGLSLLASGVGAVLYPKFYNKLFEQLLDSFPSIYIMGLIMMMIGFLLINFYGSWTWNFPVIITLFGWIAFLKGLIMIIMPKDFIGIAKVLRPNAKALVPQAWFVTIVGAAITYIGYILF